MRPRAGPRGGWQLGWRVETAAQTLAVPMHTSPISVRLCGAGTTRRRATGQAAVGEAARWGAGMSRRAAGAGGYELGAARNTVQHTPARLSRPHAPASSPRNARCRPPRREDSEKGGQSGAARWSAAATRSARPRARPTVHRAGHERRTQRGAGCTSRRSSRTPPRGAPPRPSVGLRCACLMRDSLSWEEGWAVFAGAVRARASVRPRPCLPCPSPARPARPRTLTGGVQATGVDCARRSFRT